MDEWMILDFSRSWVWKTNLFQPVFCSKYKVLSTTCRLCIELCLVLTTLEQLQSSLNTQRPHLNETSMLGVAKSQQSGNHQLRLKPDEPRHNYSNDKSGANTPPLFRTQPSTTLWAHLPGVQYLWPPASAVRSSVGASWGAGCVAPGGQGRREGEKVEGGRQLSAHHPVWWFPQWALLENKYCCWMNRISDGKSNKVYSQWLRTDFMTDDKKSFQTLVMECQQTCLHKTNLCY